MLDLTPINEARALLAHVDDGEDPEPTAALWLDATEAEVRLVVHHALIMRPSEEGAEWWGDFISAHRYMRRHGVAAALREVR